MAWGEMQSKALISFELDIEFGFCILISHASLVGMT